MKNISIGKKLAIGFSIVLSLTLLVTAISIYDFNKVNQHITIKMDHSVQKLDKLLMLDKTVNSYGYAILGSLKSATPEDMKIFKDFSLVYKDDVNKYEKELKNLIDNEPSTTYGHQKSVDLINSIIIQRQNLDKHFLKLETLKNTDSESANNYFLNTLIPDWNKYRLDKRDFVAHFHDEFSKASSDIHADNYSSMTAISIFSLIALMLGAFIAYYITKSITKPLKQALDTSKEIAQGIFIEEKETQIYSTDETGELLKSINTMKVNLISMISQIRTNAIQLENASSEIAQGNIDLSSRTEEQAASLEETAATMEQITSTIQNTSENANNVNELSRQLSSNANNGASMVREVANKVLDIKKSSHKMQDIISVIDGIAFQTNILALNAAVEAARAGEHGRGFAVVASEVRSLSQRSSSAAKEIKDLIVNSSQLIDESTVFTKNVEDEISNIAQSFTKVSEIIEEINIATKEQSHSVAQINHAISQMDQVTQQNASLVEESAAAASSLKKQSEDLSILIQKFVIK